MSFFYFLQRERKTYKYFVDGSVVFDQKKQKLSNFPLAKSNRKGPNSVWRNLGRQSAPHFDVALSKNLGSLKKFESNKAKAFVLEKTNKQIISSTEITKKCFWNQTFDKGRLKNFVLWFFLKYGEHKTVRLVEELKTIGFHYATKAGISLGVEDLKIPPKKAALIYEAEKLSLSTIRQFKRGEITEVERFQRLIDTWHRTSEQLKIEVIENFEGTDVLNPVYMMAFSGARGNISQVRQLVGMRGLMSNPQGQIIDFPIRSNFREGLTLTEYIISSYGARKGIVDTALRTANAGYLTRRLVDVAQHVIISTTDCGTTRGIFLNDMKEGNKTIYSLQNRLVGRVLARDVYNNQNKKIASKNMEISGDLAILIAQHHKKIFVRSPLTCQTNKLVCQLCYGWSLAQGNLVSIGEAVGIVAAQSIGEPGTQLTMRTFHTGGVFSGNVSDQIKAPFDGFVVYNNPIAGKLIRTPEGKIAFLTKDEGSFSVYRFSKIPRPGEHVNLGSGSTIHGHIFSQNDTGIPNDLNLETLEKRNYKIPFYTLLFLRNREPVFNKQVIAQISSINRQKTATDQAELTIKAEISGLFYSKNLEIEETKSGFGIKESTTGASIKKTSTHNKSLVKGRRKGTKKDLASQSDELVTHFASETQTLQDFIHSNSLQEESEENLLRESDIVDQSLVDIINKSWNWGYAWILSGKIYQLPFPSNFFPIFGDFVTKKTYMNCINWYLPSTFGSGFKINRPLTYSVFNQKTIKKMRQTLFSKEEFNLSPRTDKLIGTLNQTKNLNKTPTSLLEKDFKLLKYDLISFELSNIIYKKIGYFLNLSQASHTSSKNPFSEFQQFNKPSTVRAVAKNVKLRSTFLNVPSEHFALGHSKPKQTLAVPQRSILSLNDTLFLYSGLFPKNRYFAEIKTENSLKINNNKPLINPTTWEPSFSVFLNWFPKRFFTKTAGILFLELFSRSSAPRSNVGTNKKINIKNDTRSKTLNIFTNSIGQFLTSSNNETGVFTNLSGKRNKNKSQNPRFNPTAPRLNVASVNNSPLDFTINFSSKINTKIDQLQPERSALRRSLSRRNTSPVERALSFKGLHPQNKPTDKTKELNKLNNLVKSSLQKSLRLRKSGIVNARIATTVPTFFKNELLILSPTERPFGNQFNFAKKSTTPVLENIDYVGLGVGVLKAPKRPFLSSKSQMLELTQSDTLTGINTEDPLFKDRVDVASSEPSALGRCLEKDEKEKSVTLTGRPLDNKQTIGELAQTLVHPKFPHSVRSQQSSLNSNNYDVPNKVSSNMDILTSDGRRQSIKTKGLFWKNHFKYNWDGSLQQKTNRWRSQLNSTIISSQRVFWVSQPFYKIQDKNNSIIINIVENSDTLQNETVLNTLLGLNFQRTKNDQHNAKLSRNGVFSISENTKHTQKSVPFKTLKSSNDNSPALVLSQINRQGKINFNIFDPNLVQISQIKTTSNSQWPRKIERSRFVESSTLPNQNSLVGQFDFAPQNLVNPTKLGSELSTSAVDSSKKMNCHYIKLTTGQLIGRLMSKQREFDKNQKNIQTRSLLCKKNNLLTHFANNTNVNKNFLVDLKTFCKLNSPVDPYTSKSLERFNFTTRSHSPNLLAKKKDSILTKKLNLIMNRFLDTNVVNFSRKKTNYYTSGQVQLSKHKHIKTSKLALFDFFFYTLFNKQYKKTQQKDVSMHPSYVNWGPKPDRTRTRRGAQITGQKLARNPKFKSSTFGPLTAGDLAKTTKPVFNKKLQTSLRRNIKNSKNIQINYNHICSPYLKEQFSKYLLNINSIFKTKTRFIWSFYNTNTNNPIHYHLFSEKNRQMFQRVNYLRQWFKNKKALASTRLIHQANTLQQKMRKSIKRSLLQQTTKQNQTEGDYLESFLNIWLKNGWFYYTTDLTQFFLNHKTLLPAGKNFDSHFIFDRDNIYIEILPINKLPSLKTFVIGSSSSIDPLNNLTSISDDRKEENSVDVHSEVLISTSKQRSTKQGQSGIVDTGLLTQHKKMPSEIDGLQGEINQSQNFGTEQNHHWSLTDLDVIPASKTNPRQPLSNTKQSLFIKQESWLTFIEKRTENILVTVNSTFNNKTEEPTETFKHLNFKKVIINKKCRFNINTNTNNTNKNKNDGGNPNGRNAPSETQQVTDIDSHSSNNNPITQNTMLRQSTSHFDTRSTTNNLVLKNQVNERSRPSALRSGVAYILLICKANEIQFFKEIESKKEIYELSKQQKEISTLYNLNKYQISLLDQRTDYLKKQKSLNNFRFWSKTRSLLLKTKNILKMRSNKLKTKMLNKVYNTSRLYMEYKTRILNKQKITSQILSKYPSSELKIISNNSVYSFLKATSERRAFGQKPNQNYHQSNNLTPNSSKLVEKSLTLKNNTNNLSPENININKVHNGVLPTIMVTCVKTFNLAPFILSYKAPYSVNFPFKTPMCFFSEQYKPTKLFRTNQYTTINQKYLDSKQSTSRWQEDNLINKKKWEQKEKSKRVESTVFKKVISTYLLKIDLLHSSELDIASIKTKDEQGRIKKQKASINSINTQVVNKSSVAQVVQTKTYCSAVSFEGVLNSVPMLHHRKLGNLFSNLGSMFFVPIAEYSLLNDFPKSIGSLNGDILPVPTKQTHTTLANKLTNSSGINNKKYLFGLHNNESLLGSLGPKLGFVNATPEPRALGHRSLKSALTTKKNGFGHIKQKNQWRNEGRGLAHQFLTNKNKLYSIHFMSYINNSVNSHNPCIKTYAHASVNGELIYRKKNLKPIDLKTSLIYNELLTLKKSIPDLSIKKILRQKLTDYFLSNKKVDHIDHSCMVLTKSDQISYAFGDSSQTYKNIYLNLQKLKTKNVYFINKMAINILNLLANPSDSYNPKITEDFTKYELHELFSGPIDFSIQNQSFVSDDQKASITANSGILELNNLPAGLAQQKSKLLVGEFLVYGDKIHPDFGITKSGQIIHINKHKITLRKGQPIFVSPQAILHKYDGDFVDEQTSVITLAYQQLKTGDIVQGIPKIEQFFEARTTKRGRLFRDSLENLLKALFNRYILKLPREQAVRQSFYKIQQIIIDGVQRVYRSQGVTIADKHLEVIVKQMTSKVRITFGGSTGYLPGEICDLYDIELLNKDIRPKILYEPIVLGITKASLEVKSFLSAASFQQTTRVLTKSALSRKNDYLNGLKENVILGNLIPAGTGYLVYLDSDSGSLAPQN